MSALLAKVLANRWVLYAGLAAALAAGAVWEYHRIDKAGYNRANGEWNAYEKAQTARVEAATAALNAKIAAKQTELNVALAKLAELKAQNETQKAVSAGLQRDLVAGNKRLSVLTRQQGTADAGQNQGGTAGTVDTGRPVTTYLDGTVAANLEWLRSTREDAINRLDACTAAYQAVETATQ